jgi:hypothetical protein
MSRLGVDFGVALRMHAAAEFHEDWALGASDDRIKWEDRP